MSRLLLAACVLVCAPLAATAQTVRVLEAGPAGERLEVTFDWPEGLAQTLDSSDADRFDARALLNLSGGAPEAYHLLRLPATRLPAVRVVEADYDAAPLPLALADSLLPAAAHARDLGTSRRQSVATLVVPAVRYADGQVLRYRRVVVDVRYGASAPTRASSLRSGAQTTSELASGTIFRIPIEAEGIYRVDAELLRGLGLDPEAVDPARVRVLHNGGAPLPQVVGEPRPVDLAAVPVWVRGGGDGSFGASDAVLFYAQGPQTWRYDGARWEHTTNPYTLRTYVFLKIDAPGVPVETRAFASNGAPDRTTTRGRFAREFDAFSWAEEGGSGLQRFSNLFGAGGGLDLAAASDLPNYAGGPVEGRVSMAIRSVGGSPGASMEVLLGSSVALAQRGSSVGADTEDPRARPYERTFSADALAFPVRARLQAGAASLIDQKGAVDWVRLFYAQSLTARGGLLRWATPPDASGALSFALAGFSAEPQVWDVTDPRRPVRLGVQASGGSYRVQLSQSAGAPRELIAFTEAAAQRPTGEGQRVANGNPRGLSGYPDYVIVAPDTFRAQAQRLADHRAQDGLRPIVVSSRLIFDAFGGGVEDPTAIRDYLRFLYERAPTGQQAPRYVLLFGDGHFNYRNLGAAVSPDARLNNWLPPYQTYTALDPLGSFTSDDFFALLDVGEGRLTSNSERIDLGIGRFPVQTGEEAATLVDKIIRYDSPETYGPWRGRYLFTADDALQGASSNDQDLHLQNADYVAELVERLDPSVHVRKVYGDSYERVRLTETELPEANDDIMRQLNSGLLAFNYSGHGSPRGLASENLFTLEDLPQLSNADRLPIFITATCSFGHWDLEDAQSLAEQTLLLPGGGGVAMFTTVRVVQTWSDPARLNLGVNVQLNRALFERDLDGKAVRFGDAYYRLKQTPPGYTANGRRFNLLGDPAQRLGLPDLRVAIDRIGETPLDSAEARVRALDEVRIAGRVIDAAGTQAEGFSGSLSLAVYDAERRVDISDIQRHMDTPYYTVGEDLIWRGEVDVERGAFEAAFVVSRDIAYADDNGQIVAYAQDPSGGRQAIGGTRRVVVGGSAPLATDDSRGPEVELFLGDETFVSGSLTAPSTELIVRLSDQTGINTVGGGVGHEMLLVVNGDEREAIDIGSFFRADRGQPRSGEVRVALDELPDGPGTLTVRAWDVLNNATEAELDFVVASDEALDVQRALAFPNPMAGATTLTFEHNQRAGTAADVRVRLFTLTGQAVRTLDAFEALPAGVLPPSRVRIPFDGRDQDGDRLAPGVYLYQIRVRVTRDDGTTDIVERVERLAIVR